MNDTQFEQLHEVLTRIADGIEDVKHALDDVHNSPALYTAFALLVQDKDQTKESAARSAWAISKAIVEADNSYKW
jgi:hypothetical protein